MRSQLIGFLGGAVLCARIASAATLTVNAGGNLRAALNAANPGDTIVLQADGVQERRECAGRRQHHRVDADGSGGSVANFNWFKVR